MGFEPVDPGVRGQHHGGKDRLARSDGFLDGPAEPVGEKLHLADLVNYDEVTVANRPFEGIHPGGLERRQVDPVFPDPVRAPDVHVGEAAPPAVQSNHLEADPAAAFPEFTGVKPAGPVFYGGRSLGHYGRLSRAGSAGYQQDAGRFWPVHLLAR